MAEKPKKRRRERGGILQVLTTNPGSGFAANRLAAISGQISELQQEAEPQLEEAPPLNAAPSEVEPAANDRHLAPSPQPEAPRAFSDMRRTKGARHEKVSGLHVHMEHIKHHGFEHPFASKSFLMIAPEDFLALLALESLAVVQVVFVIWRETVGWEDPGGLHGRREWVGISPQDFERRGIAGRAQARRGLKRAEEQGYIVKRAAGNGFEYAIRWA